MEIRESYQGRISALTAQITRLRQKKRRFGLGRLVSFLAAVVLFFALLIPYPLAAVTTAIVLLCAFLVLALKDLDNTRKLQTRQMLEAINSRELEALDGPPPAGDDGAAFLPASHDYAHDLDIFAPAGLYRFINRTTAYPSGVLLAARLLDAPPAGQIPGIQQAVRELTGEVDWRQELEVAGRLSAMHPEAYHQIKAWSKAGSSAGKNRLLRLSARMLPLLTLALVLLAWSGILPWKILWIALGYHMVAMWRIDKATASRYQAFSDAVRTMEHFGAVLTLLTAKRFSAPLLRDLQTRCFDGEASPATTLARLKSILGRLDLRGNPLVHFPLNLAVFWDWHQYEQLDRWKQRHPARLLTWIDTFSEMEVLCSLANIAYNHPGWVFPEIDNGEDFHFSATAMGHPLITAEKRVCNDVEISASQMLLVTGSNMAGKSTFLRTVGINMVLGLAGAPVCARRLRLPAARVVSSMRIADNLEENISTFHAELRKLEVILKKVRAHQKVLLLLDEILRGTNSHDRHTGTRALIRTFIENHTQGIVATHDLALTALEETFPGRLVNYHFDVQVEGEALYFDYRLKPGICTSMNASLLMRKIGIDL